MSTITALIAKLQTLDLRNQVPVIIEQTKQDLITLNQNQLYYLGKDSTGAELKPYSFLTEHYKREKRQPFDRTTLKDTGEFYSKFTIEATDSLIVFNSTDPKTPKLEAKYGNQIFGLTKENKTVYSKGVFYDLIKRYISQKTGLQFR